MANLEHLDFQPWREVQAGETLSWEPDGIADRVQRLPQIFWKSGEGWTEANLWALDKVTNQRCNVQTAESLMKHLHSYAGFLEEHGLDWRHFPLRMLERAVVRFRGTLIRLIESGDLAPSTARSRISAIVQFYRFAADQEFIQPTTHMWRERAVVLPFYDTHGFKRALTRFSTDLSIPNRPALGERLEDGLTPLSETHMNQLLAFTACEETEELHLMLTIGFFTGARLHTISTLRIENLENATPDSYIENIFLIRVGPGTKVKTKFNVTGDLLVPKALLDELKRYAYSVKRLKREAKASHSDKTLLFLTSRGNPYSNTTIGTLISELRRKGRDANLKFIDSFKFHQTRATYGTWLMKLTLSLTTPAAAIEFVKNAMHHKQETTTFKYIKFLESTKGKQEAAQAFHEIFTGLKNRNWGDFDA
ncbi:MULTISPECIES: tyrosine-type recombinase/integrase [Pseudomonas]|jgi:integrase|uniref:Site-specific integrase n=1 Tax=Pseudomonas auratipiscis TaxID=3115853 RepID=A0AB35WSC5_9PSED|nr:MULTISPECIES: site-specific integrase [Pseudomonas]MDO1434405.1 site-specific integrase [Pseudomonas aeruginosa]MEE1867611.1 site-specific integrase [Pseudomonas sp. 120P]MEE1958438.1 site-specific integrase [Pseudomonas sp. 119P]